MKKKLTYLPLLVFYFFVVFFYYLQLTRGRILNEMNDSAVNFFLQNKLFSIYTAPWQHAAVKPHTVKRERESSFLVECSVLLGFIH